MLEFGNSHVPALWVSLGLGFYRWRWFCVFPTHLLCTCSGPGAFKLSTSGGHRREVSKVTSMRIAKGHYRCMFSGDKFLLRGTGTHVGASGKQHGDPELSLEA